ncbi:uncharacterized protein LOC27207962 [Drosophila simulans]|nr:uncharacterized protein LOC27207962 [Drosophila simulans]KMZ05956.1 uncharacterized protein Dsimw501_GD28113 [Drosophila simulans]
MKFFAGCFLLLLGFAMAQKDSDSNVNHNVININ